jgi:hypothetical protein
MLSDSRARISEVAYDVGSKSLSQFNRAFKKFAAKRRANIERDPVAPLLKAAFNPKKRAVFPWRCVAEVRRRPHLARGRRLLGSSFRYRL